MIFATALYCIPIQYARLQKVINGICLTHFEDVSTYCLNPLLIAAYLLLESKSKLILHKLIVNEV